MSKLNIRKKFSIYDTNNASLDEGMKKKWITALRTYKLPNNDTSGLRSKVREGGRIQSIVMHLSNLSENMH